MTKLHQILFLFVAVTTSHFPVALLQVGVWVSMFEEFYNETQSVAVSARCTFDGQHRCEGCDLVNGVASGTENLLLQEALKKDSLHTLMEADNFISTQSYSSKHGIFESKLFEYFYNRVELPPPQIVA